MEIITLQEYTDQYVSLYEGEIRNLPNDLALRLINKGVAAQHDKDILNSTTTQDNGKVLTVVNGKPAFSAPATVNSEFVPNYTIYYAKYTYTNEVGYLYTDINFINYVSLEKFLEDFENKDFIIIHYYGGYDEYAKGSMNFITKYQLTQGESEISDILIQDASGTHYYIYKEADNSQEQNNPDPKPNPTK